MEGNIRINLFIITSAISEVLTFARTVVSVHRTIVLKHNILIQKTFFFFQYTQAKKVATITEVDIHNLVQHTIFYLKIQAIYLTSIYLISSLQYGH